MLSQLQNEFLYALGRLLIWSHDEGYQLTGGELYRTPEQCEWNAVRGLGIANSLHSKRLAIDLNIIIAGQLAMDILEYRPLGAFWKGLHPLARWGGDFHSRDAGHFSFQYGGIQ